MAGCAAAVTSLKQRTLTPTNTVPLVRSASAGATSDVNRQKQVDAAIERAFKRQKHKGKCRAVLTGDGIYMTFYHYQHTLLVYDLARGKAVMTWSEKPTDRRILRAALANLEARYGAGRKA